MTVPKLAAHAGVLAISVAVWATTSTAHALPIQVDVGGYAGQYRVDGVAATGSRIFDLVPGGHVFSNQSESGFSFVVATDGSVASVNNAVAATAVGTTLALANATVAIDPAAYVGRYFMADVVPLTPRVGPSSIVVIPGLRSRINNGSFIGGSEFSYRVGGDGSVESLSANSAIGSAATLVFRNTTVTVDPQDYTGNYATVLNNLVRATGARSFVAIPAQRYSIDLGAALGGSAFTFEVTADGTVTTTSPAATGSGASLVLANRAVTIDAGEFTGGWVLSSHRELGFVAGDRSLILVPAIRYAATFGGVGGMSIVFDIDGIGDVVVVTADAAVGSGSIMRFNTEVVRVTPSTSSAYRVGVRPFVSGEQTFALIPNLRWSIDNGATGTTFALSHPCAVDPPTLTLAGNTFALSCGAVDADGDGVPDASDVCPAIPDPDQLDLDGDGLGDACDPDLDGDGVPNSGDVCPDVSDDQADRDHDWIGDACDADDDGDLVADLDDNCIGVPNPEQADADGDGLGDACDADADDDGMPNGGDNCPLLYNASQADSDQDGQGDACDGDDDGDGLADASDLCPGSATDLPIDAGGCTGSQRIELRCSMETFVNHGQYVSCVAREATSAQREGLITEAERARIVSGAARRR